jgi:plasmid stabilization system protein ParE
MSLSGIGWNSPGGFTFRPCSTGDTAMRRGDKSKYTDKQERKADHIAEGYEKRGVSEKEAERRAWATVNKDDGGGKKEGGSGRGKHTGHPAAHKAAKAAARRQPHAQLQVGRNRRGRPRQRASGMPSTMPIDVDKHPLVCPERPT